MDDLYDIRLVARELDSTPAKLLALLKSKKRGREAGLLTETQIGQIYDGFEVVASFADLKDRTRVAAKMEALPSVPVAPVEKKAALEGRVHSQCPNPQFWKVQIEGRTLVNAKVMTNRLRETIRPGMPVTPRSWPDRPCTSQGAHRSNGSGQLSRKAAHGQR